MSQKVWMLLFSLSLVWGGSSSFASESAEESRGFHPVVSLMEGAAERLESFNRQMEAADADQVQEFVEQWRGTLQGISKVVDTVESQFPSLQGPMDEVQLHLNRLEQSVSEGNVDLMMEEKRRLVVALDDLIEDLRGQAKEIQTNSDPDGWPARFQEFWQWLELLFSSSG